MDQKTAMQMEANKQAIFETSGKITSEQDFRRSLLSLAAAQGCSMELQIIFDRYTRLLQGCTNQMERKHISVMGLAEVHKLLNAQGALVVNGVEILPAIGELKE